MNPYRSLTSFLSAGVKAADDKPHKRREEIERILKVDREKLDWTKEEMEEGNKPALRYN